MKQAQNKPNSKEILKHHQNYLFFINPLHAIWFSMTFAFNWL
jgi:hypothetical protein